MKLTINLRILACKKLNKLVSMVGRLSVRSPFCLDAICKLLSTVHYHQRHQYIDSSARCTRIQPRLSDVLCWRVRKGVHVTELRVRAISVKVLHCGPTNKSLSAVLIAQSGRLIDSCRTTCDSVMDEPTVQLVMGREAWEVWQQISVLTNKEMRQLWKTMASDSLLLGN